MIKTNLKYLVTTVATAVCFYTPVTLAGYKSGCDGIIYFKAAQIEDVYGNTGLGSGARPPVPHEQVVDIEGSGKCSHKGQANTKCRPKARDAAVKCARAIWRSGTNTVPRECGRGANASIRKWAPSQPSNIQTSTFGNIKKAIQYQACCRVHPTVVKGRFFVQYLSRSPHTVHFTNGKERRDNRAQKACNHSELLATYAVNCAILAADGLCGEPQIRSAANLPRKSRPDSKQADPSKGEQKRKKRPTAKTSKNTSTTSASHADIRKALDKKRRQQAKKAKLNANRTNRVN